MKELEELISDPYHRYGYEAAIRITNDRENVLGKLRELDPHQDKRSRGVCILYVV